MNNFLARKFNQFKDPRIEYPKPLSYADFSDHVADLLEQGWLQCAEARGSNGKIVKYNHKDAISWCATGAIDFAFYKYRPITTEAKESWFNLLYVYVCSRYIIPDYYTHHIESNLMDLNMPIRAKLIHLNDIILGDQARVVRFFRDFASNQRLLDPENYLIKPNVAR